jgi:hypothetical protein
VYVWTLNDLPDVQLNAAIDYFFQVPVMVRFVLREENARRQVQMPATPPWQRKLTLPLTATRPQFPLGHHVCNIFQVVLAISNSLFSSPLNPIVLLQPDTPHNTSHCPS